VNLVDPSGEQAAGGPASYYGINVEGREASRMRNLQARFDRMSANASGMNMVTSQGDSGLQISFDGEPGNINANEMAVLTNVFPPAIGLAGGGAAPATGIAGATTRGTGTLVGSSRVQNIHPGNLIPTHGRTLSNRQFAGLKSDIKANGIQNPIKFATDGTGRRFIVDGVHRQLAARQLGLERVPVQEVSLPFRGFQSTDDLVPFFGGQ